MAHFVVDETTYETAASSAMLVGVPAARCHHLVSLLMQRRPDGRPHPRRTFTGPPIDRFFDNFPLVAVDSCLVYSSIMQGRSIVEPPQRSDYR